MKRIKFTTKGALIVAIVAVTMLSGCRYVPDDSTISIPVPTDVADSTILEEIMQSPTSGETPTPTAEIKTEMEPANIVVGKRWYEEYTDHLIACEDYGELIPFVGAADTEGEFFNDRFIYGLMTKNGIVVTDPVYDICYRSEVSGTNAAFILRKYNSNNNPSEQISVVATDGSWCLEFDASRVESDKYGIRLFSDSAMMEVSTEGELLDTYYYKEMDISSAHMDILLEHVHGGFGITGERRGMFVSLMQIENDNLLVLDMSSGKSMIMSHSEWMNEYEADTALQWEEIVENGQTIMRRGDESYTIPYVLKHSYNSVHGNLVLFRESGAVYTLDGEVFLPEAENSKVYWLGDSLADNENGVVVRFIYDELKTTMSCYRCDGTELMLPKEWKEWTTAVEIERDIWVVGGFLQLVDSNGAYYYDIETAELVCAFEFA